VTIQFKIEDAAPPVQLNNIHWIFMNHFGGTKILEKTNTTMLSFSSDYLTLNIKQTQLNNSGTYTLNASNPAGRSSASSQLDVLGK